MFFFLKNQKNKNTNKSHAYVCYHYCFGKLTCTNVGGLIIPLRICTIGVTSHLIYTDLYHNFPTQIVLCDTMLLCDVIKQNEAELINTDFKIKPNKADNFLFSPLPCRRHRQGIVSYSFLLSFFLSFFWQHF